MPVFKTDPITGEFVKDAKGNFVYDEFPRDGYLVRRYRPRIEGLFARIERWTRQSDGEVYWRSISKDNITTFYGKTEESRIANPEDPSQIFSWLICQSYDDKGNAIVYKYKAENSDGIDLAQVHENNRTLQVALQIGILKVSFTEIVRPIVMADWNATTRRSFQIRHGCSKSSSTMRTVITRSNSRMRTEAYLLKPDRPTARILLAGSPRSFLFLSRWIRSPNIPALPARADVPSFSR